MEDVIHTVSQDGLGLPSKVCDDGYKARVVDPFLFNNQPVLVQVYRAMGTGLAKQTFCALVHLIYIDAKGGLDVSFVFFRQHLGHGNYFGRSDVDGTLGLGVGQAN